MSIKKYEHFLILEKFDDNIIAELRRLGVTDEDEIKKHLYHAHRGNLAKYLQETGKNITFGMLRALFLDSQAAKKRTDIKVGIIKAVHRVVPMALAPFFPILAIVGYILGTSRAFNKVIAPVLADPGNDYPEFLNKLITSTMKVAEGEIIPIKDRFTRAFVVSDGIIDALKEEVLRDFSNYLSNKMSKKNPDEEVPEHYVENELKSYLNKRYDIDPQIPLKINESSNTDNLILKYGDVINKIDSDIEYIKDVLLSLEDLGFFVNVDYTPLTLASANPNLEYNSDVPEFYVNIVKPDSWIQFYDKTYPLINKEKEKIDSIIFQVLEYMNERGYKICNPYYMSPLKFEFKDNPTRILTSYQITFAY
jgi:hypothetical protein